MNFKSLNQTLFFGIALGGAVPVFPVAPSLCATLNKQAADIVAQAKQRLDAGAISSLELVKAELFLNDTKSCTMGPLGAEYVSERGKILKQNLEIFKARVKEKSASTAELILPQAEMKAFYASCKELVETFEQQYNAKVIPLEDLTAVQESCKKN